MPEIRPTINIALVILAFFLGLAQFAAAGDKSEIIGELKIPEEGKSQIIITHGGSKVVGRIVEIKDDEIMFESDIGVSAVLIEDIKEIREIKTGGKYWFPNPNQTRLFFSPTGRMLQKGEGYFSDIYIFFPSFSYALTDNVTMGAGFSIFPGVDIDEQLLFFTPKVGIAASDKFSFAMSGFIVRFPKEYDWDNNESMAVGILFGTGTYGTPDKSLSFGLGFGFVDDELGDKPAVMLGGEYRIARRTALVTENWIFPDADHPLISYGVRLFGEMTAIDLAFLNTFDEDMPVIGIPYIDFVWNF
ncbi:MAG TPA: hypothetical protein ENH25_03310 [candidate division Zixibacteria bacterium]|nr:hypothetical protein [candidate division Zixibacteria bacterium]